MMKFFFLNIRNIHIIYNHSLVHLWIDRILVVVQPMYSNRLLLQTLFY